MFVRPRFRRRSASLIAVLSLTAAAVVMSPAAQADVGDLVCLDSAGYIEFDPPLQSGVTSSVTAHVSTNNPPLTCISPNGMYPNLDWYDEAVTGTATVSSVVPGGGICNLLFTLNGTGNLTWSDSTTGTDEITFQTDPGNPGTLGGNATITSGHLEGDTVTIVEAVIVPNLNCVTAGLSRIDFLQAANTFS